MKKELFVIAHNIRSAHNVGAFFRTADGAGVSKIYLTGYTLEPYRENRITFPTQAQKMLAKTALGAEKSVPWEKVEDIDVLLRNLNERGFQVVALENKVEGAESIFTFQPKFPCVLILGNEVEGIEKAILDECDVTVEIPMRGKKESLNVSVAAGIAMYLVGR